MARPDLLFVFCYDVERDSLRNRIAGRLEEVGVRVQMSVFEVRLEARRARKLFAQLSALLGPRDSLRCYCIPESGRRSSLAQGGPPITEDGDFWLL
jgi:CRISPR-associated protein Cas2